MPCYDYVNDTRPTQRDLDAALTNAVLCAFSRCIKNHTAYENFLENVDWEESGITKEQYLSWWHRHKLIDEDRIFKLRDQIELEKKRKAALNKLTNEERLILGLR